MTYTLFYHVVVIFLPTEPGAVTYRYCIFVGGNFDRWEGNGNLERTLDTSYPEDKIGLKTDLPVVSVETNPGGSSFLARQFEAIGLSNKQDSEMNSNDAVIIVSYFLPVTLSR